MNSQVSDRNTFWARILIGIASAFLLQLGEPELDDDEMVRRALFDTTKRGGLD